jgi:hypothetical protein
MLIPSHSVSLCCRLRARSPSAPSVSILKVDGRRLQDKVSYGSNYLKLDILTLKYIEVLSRVAFEVPEVS